jgi:hypothetical protein
MTSANVVLDEGAGTVPLVEAVTSLVVDLEHLTLTTDLSSARSTALAAACPDVAPTTLKPNTA